MPVINHFYYGSNLHIVENTGKQKKNSLYSYHSGNFNTGFAYSLLNFNLYLDTRVEVPQLALVVKNPPARRKETLFESLVSKDALGKEMVTHSSIPAWRIPWTEEPGGL